MPDSTHPTETPASASTPSRRRMTTRQRLLFLLTGWLIVLMPFLFWWNTWFGRHLTDQQVTEYLRDDKHPRRIQHALIQIGDRMQHRGAKVQQWYPELVRLSSYSVEEVRNTDAWIMGQDNSCPDFHAALLKMLNDPSVMVRGNAALSLVRFGDASGRSQLVALLQPIKIVSPANGEISDTASAGTAVRQAGLIAKLEHGDRGSQELRSPITGRVRSVEVRVGQQVAPGTQIAIVEPDTEQVWEALRGLYAIGELEDLSAVSPYERELPDIPDRVRQQAKLTEEAIRSRSK